MTASQLARRTEELGNHLPRGVLANFEKVYQELMSSRPALGQDHPRKLVAFAHVPPPHLTLRMPAVQQTPRGTAEVTEEQHPWRERWWLFGSKPPRRCAPYRASILQSSSATPQSLLRPPGTVPQRPGSVRSRRWRSRHTACAAAAATQIRSPVQQPASHPRKSAAPDQAETRCPPNYLPGPGPGSPRRSPRRSPTDHPKARLHTERGNRMPHTAHEEIPGGLGRPARTVTRLGSAASIDRR